MSLPAAASEALQAFAACPGWDQRARLQMQWGERLEPLSAEQCSNEHLVRGCASQVWLLGQQFAALDSGMVGSGGLGLTDWLVIAMIPLIGVLLALVTARITIALALRDML